MIEYSIVVPTLGRASLHRLLTALAACPEPWPRRVVLVDDRVAPTEPVVTNAPGWLRDLVVVRHGNGRGPAAARNIGWRACATEWVAFLDDDVVVPQTWTTDVGRDLDAAAADVAAVTARIEVPLPADRRPTDWERGTAGLATAKWITADMAYRRTALATVAGFDERFPRAFREDADLALRVIAQGWRIEPGRRTTVHPVRPAPWRASLDQQRGNADDVLMTRVHGRDWYARADAPRGRRSRHLAITATGLTALAALTARRPPLALAAAAAWSAGTAEFALARILPGPRHRAEVGALLATSVAIPPAATWHWLRGLLRHRGAGPWCPPADAVLFDRDGTLVHDVPYNGDPERVRPIDGAREAVDRLRAADLRVGVVTNQSGVARGLIDDIAVKSVNTRVDELVGPFDTWQVCPHGEDDGCDCRKPAPGLVRAAAEDLGVPVERCIVVGDTAADVGAAFAAGAAAAFLVPNLATRRAEIGAAPWTARTLGEAVEYVVRGRWSR